MPPDLSAGASRRLQALELRRRTGQLQEVYDLFGVSRAAHSDALRSQRAERPSRSQERIARADRHELVILDLSSFRDP